MKTKVFAASATMVILFSLFGILTWPPVDAAPVADAGLAPGQSAMVDPGQAIAFDASGSTGAGLSYRWFFHDAGMAGFDWETNTATAATPGYTFLNEGVYVVTLVVQDTFGRTDVDTVQVTVRNLPPVAVATANGATAVTVAEDQTIAFDSSGTIDTAVDLLAGLINRWDFGDGSISTVASTGHAFPRAGSYPVTFTATDDDGAFDRVTIPVTVVNQVPAATVDMDGNPVSRGGILVAAEDEDFAFVAVALDTVSDMSALDFHWDLGDGSEASGTAAGHAYSKMGTYTVTMTVTDDDEARDPFIFQVQVDNQPPVAAASPDLVNVDEGTTVSLDGLGTTDTPTDEPLLSYQWSFGSVPPSARGGDAGVRTTNVWLDDGSFPLDLAVTDDNGASSTDTTQVTVGNVVPAPRIVDAFLPVDITLRAAGEKWHDLVLEVIEATATQTNIGVYRTPGSPDDQAATATDVKVNIAESVTIRVRYTPLDDGINGNVNGATPVWVTLGFDDVTETVLFRSFNVQQPSEWEWIVDLNSYLVGHPIHFEGRVFDAGSDDIDVDWVFGDGVQITRFFARTDGAPQDIVDRVTHTYGSGSFSLSLEARDDEGASATFSAVVTSSDRLTIDNVAPKADGGLDRLLHEDEMMNVAGVGSDTVSDQPGLTYHWVWGDGSGDPGSTQAHSYPLEGLYFAVLRVQDSTGATGFSVVRVDVANQAAALAGLPDFAVTEDQLLHFDALATDTPSDVPLLLFTWDFGDGQKSAGTSADHSYPGQGAYSVRLAVTDDDGAITATLFQVMVDNVDPVLLSVLATAAVPGDGYQMDEVVFFTAVADDTLTDLPDLDYAWSFGDGAVATGRRPTHWYDHPDTFHATLTVTDDDGAAVTQLLDLAVMNAPPLVQSDRSLTLYGPAMTLDFEGRFDDTVSTPSGTVVWFVDGIAQPTGSLLTLTFASHVTTTLRADGTDAQGAVTSWTLTVNVHLDSDGDNLLDMDEEDIWGSSPLLTDTDGDGLIDSYEVVHVDDFLCRNPGANGLGYGADCFVNPTLSDTDFDGLTDWEERWQGEDGWITNPNASDTDGDGMLDGSERFTFGFKVDVRGNIPDEGTRTLSLNNVGTSAPATEITNAEVRFGISHGRAQDLSVQLAKVGGASALLVPAGSRSGMGVYLDFTLFDHGFTVFDVTGAKSSWTLDVQDHAKDEVGSIEYFEMHLTARTNPIVSDSDGDLLDDEEELNPGVDGWLTDPWLADTDGDSLSDGFESLGWNRVSSVIIRSDTGFKTDPTRTDTDRDGTMDASDKAPIRNMMMEITIESFLAEDNDESLDGEFPEPFVGIKYGDPTIFTPHLDPAGNSATFGHRYTLDYPDGSDGVSLTFSAWDDDPLADKEWDIHFGGGKKHSYGYSLSDGDTGTISTSGTGDGEDTEIDARLQFRIRPVELQRIPTLLVESLDTDDVYRTPSGEVRFMGEQKFYLFWIYASSTRAPVQAGLNAIFVPRAQFLNSTVNATLDPDDPSSDPDADLPARLKQLEFTYYDSEEAETTGTLVSVVHGSLTGNEARNLLFDLITGPSGVVNGAWVDVTDGLETLGLDTDLIQKVPYAPVAFDSTGDGPNNILDVFVGFFLSMGKLVLDGLIWLGTAIADFFAAAGEALAQLGMAILGAIVAAFEFVVAVVKAVLDVLNAFIDWILGLVRGIVDAIFAPIAEAVRNLIDSFINGLVNGITLSVADYEASSTIGGASVRALEGALLGPLFGILSAVSIAILVALYILTPFTFLFGFLLGFIATLIVLVVWQVMFAQPGGAPVGSGTGVSEGTTFAQIPDLLRIFVTSSPPNVDGRPTAPPNTDSLDGPSALDIALGILSFFFRFSALVILIQALTVADLSGTAAEFWSAILGIFGLIIVLTGVAVEIVSNLVGGALLLLGGAMGMAATFLGLRALRGLPQLRPYALATMALGGIAFGLMLVKIIV